MHGRANPGDVTVSTGLQPLHSRGWRRALRGQERPNPSACSTPPAPESEQCKEPLVLLSAVVLKSFGSLDQFYIL